MATIQDVARLAGVSVGSVSHYLNGKKLKPKTATKIERVIGELDYQVSIFGKSLRSTRSYSVGVLVNDITNVFGSAISRNVESGLEKAGLTTLLVDYRGSLDLLKKKTEFLLARHVDALVIIISEQNIDDVGWLESISKPVIIVDNPVFSEKFPCVVTNNSESVAAVVSKMIELGHNRIGLITPPNDTYVGQNRREGWYKAYATQNMIPNVDDIVTCSYDIDAGYQAMLSLIDKKEVTCVFASSYYLAFGALKAIFERQLVLGQDIGFASFDDFGFSSIISPPVTVIQQPVEQMSEYIVMTLQSMGEATAENWPTGINIFKSQIKYTNSIVRP